MAAQGSWKMNDARVPATNPTTHAGNLNLSVAGTRGYEHGYDLAGSPLFGGNHGLANALLLFRREKSFRIDHLTNSPKRRRRRSLPLLH